MLETLQLVLPRDVHAAVRAALAEIYAEVVIEGAAVSKDWMAAELGGPFGE